MGGKRKRNSELKIDNNINNNILENHVTNLNNCNKDSSESSDVIKISITKLKLFVTNPEI